jgi:hypothetical protein
MVPISLVFDEMLSVERDAVSTLGITASDREFYCMASSIVTSLQRYTAF